MTRRVRIAIVGAGTAGLAALAWVRKETQDFVLVNDGAYGTTCARVGCMPSKALIEVANSLHALRYFHDAGVLERLPSGPDIASVLAHVRRVRDRLVEDVLKLTDDLGERNIAGRARLVAPHALDIGGQRIEAERIVLATGSRPIVPDAWRRLDDRIVTTDELFEQPSLPQRIAVVGLGAVGTELAQALARLGLRVSAFGRRAAPCAYYHPTLEEALRGALRDAVKQLPFERAPDLAMCERPAAAALG